jgi:hypothetical protein
MTMTTEAQHKIEAYLERLRKRLRGLKDEDVREIVEELRSHIVEKAVEGGQGMAAGVDAALAGLGSPEELAGQYVAGDFIAQARVGRSPIGILKSLFHWASLSVAGFLVMLVSIVGYVLGISLIACALLKPIHPQTAGLWIIPDPGGDFQISLRLGFSGPPAGGRELLGWWIVPLALAAGTALRFLTTKFAIWCARLYRRSRALPRG